VPLFYNPSIQVSISVAEACSAGGARILEFTNRGDRAYEVFGQLSQYINENKLSLILGVGSVIDAPTAARYIGAGANFVVGPILNPDVARICNRRKIAYLPGCATLTEISQAEELGAEIVKIFPGSTTGGPSFIKSILGPCPWTRIMPTGGVSATEDNIRDWIEAGACCVGMGSKLITKDAVAAENYQEIRKTIKLVLGWIADARKNER
jgi:2-dehydro-3-deoxyphosphogluconate aldolase/(4S)-4-hydroxy-2-oxoglutarate aldolase